MTCLCHIAWTSGGVPLEWQTGVVIPFFMKGDWRVCSKQWGITLLNLLGNVYFRMLDSDSRGVLWFSFLPWKTRPALHPRDDTVGGIAVCPTSPHFLWIWRRLMTVSLKVSFGGAPGVWGRWPFVTGHLISVLSESDLGSHCRQ